MKNLKVYSIVLVLMVGLFQACHKEEDFAEPIEDPIAEFIRENENRTPLVRPVSNIPPQVRGKLEKMGFTIDERTYRLGDTEGFEGTEKEANSYVVEGDMLISESQMDAMLVPSTIKDSSGQTRRVYRYKNWVARPFDGSQKTIKVHLGFWVNFFMESDMQAAMDRYNNLDLGIRFELTTSKNNADIKAYWDVISELALTDLPEGEAGQAVDKPGENMRIKFDLLIGFHGQRVSLLAHELGHAIGMLHTNHLQPQAFQNCQGSESSTTPDSQYYAIDGTENIATAALQDSYMISCAVGYDLPFTMADKIGLYNLFGKNKNGGNLLIRYNGVKNGTNVFSYHKEYTGLEYTTDEFDSVDILGRISSSAQSGYLPLYEYDVTVNGITRYYVLNYWSDSVDINRFLGYLWQSEPSSGGIEVRVMQKSNDALDQVMVTSGADFNQKSNEGYSNLLSLGYLAGK